MNELNKLNKLNEQDKDINSELKHEKIKGDISLKIISVLLAVLIWFWVIGFESHVTQKKFNTVVHMDNVGEMASRYGYSILITKEIFIDVILEGKSSDLNRIKPDDIYAYADFKNVTQAGEINLPIEIKDIDYVTVAELSQNSIIVPVDKKTSKDIPVMGKIIQIAYEAGAEIENLVFNPETITVSGPEMIINNIAHAQVNLSLSADKPIERSAWVTSPFTLIDKKGEEVKNAYIKSTESSVDVYIPVYTTKEIPLIINYKYGYYNNKNTNIEIIPDKIKVRGSPDYLNSFNEINIGIIDEKQYDSDTMLTRNIPLPDEIKNLSGVTTAGIKIEFIDTEKRTMSIPLKQNSRFTVIPPKNFEYHIKEENIQIKLLGPFQNLNNITRSVISVSADLSNYSEKGTYSVTVDIVTSDASVFCVGEYEITVEVY